MCAGGRILLNNTTLRLKRGRRYGLCGVRPLPPPCCVLAWSARRRRRSRRRVYCSRLGGPGALAPARPAVACPEAAPACPPARAHSGMPGPAPRCRPTAPASRRSCAPSGELSRTKACLGAGRAGFRVCLGPLRSASIHTLAGVPANRATPNQPTAAARRAGAAHSAPTNPLPPLRPMLAPRHPAPGSQHPQIGTSPQPLPRFLCSNGKVDGFPPKEVLRTVYVEHDIDASGGCWRSAGLRGLGGERGAGTRLMGAAARSVRSTPSTRLARLAPAKAGGQAV